MGPITLAKADELFWLGRYTERVFTTLRRFFDAYDADDGTKTEGFVPFCRALDIPFDAGEPIDELLSHILYDPDNSSSVCSSMRSAFGNAILLRPELGTETTSYIELALLNLKGSKDPAERLPLHRSVRDDLLAFWGAVEDGMGSGEAKALLFLGKYVERIELWSRFGVTEQELDRPVRKLIFYLGYVRHPECLPLADAIATLAGDVEARGYGEFVTDRLRTALEEVRA